MKNHKFYTSEQVAEMVANPMKSGLFRLGELNASFEEMNNIILKSYADCREAEILITLASIGLASIINKSEKNRNNVP